MYIFIKHDFQAVNANRDQLINLEQLLLLSVTFNLKANADILK